MVKFDVDLVQGEIPRRIRLSTGELRLNPDFPHSGCCAGGHAPAPPMETRFFDVVTKPGSKVAEILDSGVYCEWCLLVANRIKIYDQQKRELDFDPELEIERLLEEAWAKEAKYYG